MRSSFIANCCVLFALLAGCAKEDKRTTTKAVPLKVSLSFPESSQEMSLTSPQVTATAALPATQFDNPESLLDGAEQRFAHKRVFRWLNYKIANSNAVLKSGSIPIEDRNKMALDIVELEANFADKLQLEFSFMQVDFMSAADADSFCSKGSPGFVRTWRASQTYTVKEGNEIALTFAPSGRSIIQMGMLRVPAESREKEKLTKLSANLLDRGTGLTLDQKICQLERPFNSEYETDAVYLRAPVFAAPIESLQLLYLGSELKIPTLTAQLNKDTLALSKNDAETLTEIGVSSAYNIEKSDSQWYLKRDSLSAVLPSAYFPRLPMSLAEDPNATLQKKVEVKNTLSSLASNRSDSVIVELVDGNDTRCSSSGVYFSKVSSAQATNLPLQLKSGAGNYRLRIRTISPQGFVTCSTHTVDFNLAGFQPDSGESKIAIGTNHTCAIQSGKLYCWGANSDGQLGDATFTDKSVPTLVAGLGGTAIAVAAGNNFTCAIVNETAGQQRALKCWGKNAGNRFGVASPTTPPSPVNRPERIAFVAGMTFSLRLTAAGEVICSIQASSDTSPSGSLSCWHDANKNSTLSGPIPSLVSQVNISKLSATNLVCVRGSVAAAGSSTAACVTYSDTGVVTTPSEITNMGNAAQSALSSTDSLDFDTGDNHVCVLQSNKIRCVGKNDSGQFGDSTIATSSTWTSTLNSGIGDFLKVAAFGNNTCGITTAAELKCWGKNDRSQLGFYSDGTSTNPTNIPGMERDVTTLVAGENHACAVQSGLLKCWGQNESGQLGRRGTARDLEYVSAPAGSALSGSTIENVAVGGAYSGSGLQARQQTHSCAIQDGRLSCWGSNDRGQLGLGTENSTPVKPQSPLNIAGKVKAIATGRSHTCSVAEEKSEVRCWGSNDSGQLGLGDTSILSKSAPTTLAPELMNVSALTAGDSHTCAVSEGRLFCWGNNDQMQLGILTGGAANLSNSIPNPKQVQLPFNVQSVATRASHTCTLSTEGTVLCFGSNSSGQLGPGNVATNTDAAAAREITELKGSTQISVGNSHSCAILSGSLLCWGSNEFGQLGRNSGTCESPTVVPGLEEGVTSVAAGEDHTCAIKNGALWCWGRSDYGQLGIGKIVPTAAATPLPAATQPPNNGSCPAKAAGVQEPTLILEAGVTHVSAGSGTCAVLYGRELKCWGTRFNGRSENSPSPAGVVAP